MPTMQDSVTVAANGVSTNQLAGQLYEFVEEGTEVTLSCVGAATGMRATFIIGVPMVNDQAIGFRAGFPIIPDDILMQGAVMGGRMVLTFRNSTGAAIVTSWRVDV